MKYTLLHDFILKKTNEINVGRWCLLFCLDPIDCHCMDKNSLWKYFLLEESHTGLEQHEGEKFWLAVKSHFFPHRNYGCKFHCYQHSSLTLKRYAHGPLAEYLMHMAHKKWKHFRSLIQPDWLNYTGFPEEVCVAFFNIPPGSKDAVAPNPLTKEKGRCVYNWRQALIRVN